MFMKEHQLKKNIRLLEIGLRQKQLHQNIDK